MKTLLSIVFLSMTLSSHAADQALKNKAKPVDTQPISAPEAKQPQTQDQDQQTPAPNTEKAKPAKNQQPLPAAKTGLRRIPWFW